MINRGLIKTKGVISKYKIDQKITVITNFVMNGFSIIIANILKLNEVVMLSVLLLDLSKAKFIKQIEKKE